MTADDYSVPILDGPGDTDYARYMRTDELLALQRTPEEVVHRDELLFQTVHQSTELWLKHASFEAEESASLIRAGQADAASRLLARASLGIELVSQQLEMLRHLTPAAFQDIRTVLGHGSGFESPGWAAVRRVSGALSDAFDALVAEHEVDLIRLYRGSPDEPLYRLAEALIEWDDRIGVWRARHFKMAIRIIGHGSIGTKGTPVDVLARMVGHQFFPQLWRVRSELTQTGPLGEERPASQRTRTRPA
jgi:tryptophan 2,3-dioxygenase